MNTKNFVAARKVHKPISLMNVATIAVKALKENGKMQMSWSRRKLTHAQLILRRIRAVIADCPGCPGLNDDTQSPYGNEPFGELRLVMVELIISMSGRRCICSDACDGRGIHA